MTVEKKTTSIAISKDLWRKLKLESMNLEVSVSSIIENLLTEHYGKDEETPSAKKGQVSGQKVINSKKGKGAL